MEMNFPHLDGKNAARISAPADHRLMMAVLHTRQLTSHTAMRVVGSKAATGISGAERIAQNLLHFAGTATPVSTGSFFQSICSTAGRKGEDTVYHSDSVNGKGHDALCAASGNPDSQRL